MSEFLAHEGRKNLKYLVAINIGLLTEPLRFADWILSLVFNIKGTAIIEEISCPGLNHLTNSRRSYVRHAP